MFRVDRIEDMGTMHEVQVQLVMGELRTELGMLIQVKQGRLSATAAMENRGTLDEEHVLFIAGGQDNVVDDDVDEQPIQDLALNTMFMANLSSADPVYDEAGPSCDLDVLSKDAVCEHHEVHKMHDDVQLNYVVDSHTGYTSDSNMIMFDQYVKDNVVKVVKSDVSAVPNDAYMMILNDIHEMPAQHVYVTTQTKIVDKSLTAELATYKEQVELTLGKSLTGVLGGYTVKALTGFAALACSLRASVFISRTSLDQNICLGVNCVCGVKPLDALMITRIAWLTIRRYPFMCFHSIGFREKIILRVCFLGSFATFSSQWGSSKLSAWLKDGEQGHVRVWGGLGMDVVRIGAGGKG
nr:hypothetical protein [Tanacetum cinerariifolium]